MHAFPPHLIRNFCITAHIDHGKTTLSSKLLTMSGLLSDSKTNKLYLDKLRVEKERGITVKAQTATMLYRYEDDQLYLMNLIDTPGHVDFCYEVSRSMAACEGALLLVDAVKGVQAQSIANWWLAVQNNLTIIPAINKIDLANAQPSKIANDLSTSLGFELDQILKFSAITGEGLTQIFPAIIENIPPPPSCDSNPFKALLFDQWYQDAFSGVICMIKIVDGSIKIGDKIVAASTQRVYQVHDVGIMFPESYSTGMLYTGQVGYVKMGMKTTQEARVGDTFYGEKHPVTPLPGYKIAKPMVYAGVYADENTTFNVLRDAMDKLLLTDSSVTTCRDVNDVLGMGYRCGFLGLLHMDVFLQRLREEYQVEAIVTAPNVIYKVSLKNGQDIEVTQASHFPEKELIRQTYEPFVLANIFLPKDYLGAITQLCIRRRGIQVEVVWVDPSRIHLIFSIPLAEVVFDFFDKLKELSSGYATLDYEESGYEPSSLVKIKILLNGNIAEPLSIICHQSNSEPIARKMVEKLKTVIHRQMFEIRLQAAIGSKIVARETIKAFRKDVTSKCYGGDITRKRKLLEKQREGKKRMKTIGNVELSSEAFMAMTKL